MTERTPPVVARAFTAALLGDPEWRTPNGVEASTYFEALELNEAFKAYRQIHQLPEGFRQRDIIERLEEDKYG